MRHYREFQAIGFSSMVNNTQQSLTHVRQDLHSVTREKKIFMAIFLNETWIIFFLRQASERRA